jgi:hypothetical protein
MTSDHTRRMFADSVSANDNDGGPVIITVDRLIRMAEERHAWLSKAAAQIEQWKAEDAAAGHPWGATDTTGDAA